MPLSSSAFPSPDEYAYACVTPRACCRRRRCCSCNQGGWAWRRVVGTFGKEILRDDGELDRNRLGSLVFSDPALRRRLDNAVKLPIWTALISEVAWHWFTCKRAVVLDVPLLFESGMNVVTRPIVVVWVPRDVQTQRLMDRDGLTRTEAIHRIDAQMPTDEKRRRSSLLIDNSGSIEELEERVDDVVRELRSTSTLLWLASTPYSCIALAFMIYKIVANL